MATIPQRDLRNGTSEMLRRAESGERLTVTVDGRPIAELDPLRTARQAPTEADPVSLFGTEPVDRGWQADLDEMRAEDRAARDPDLRPSR